MTAAVLEQSNKLRALFCGRNFTVLLSDPASQVARATSQRLIQTGVGVVTDGSGFALVELFDFRPRDPWTAGHQSKAGAKDYNSSLCCLDKASC